MAEITWSKEQTQAINEKGSNLLVAAAAGSGKTTVLVERIIRKIINEKMDIDKLLVVTFTNAAASEMRERILNAIYKKIEENPNDIHLQKQITLLNKASICTIHSFCLNVIRNYFYEIDVPANFQIGDSTEMELLKQEALDEVLEEKYAQKEESFLKLVDTYANYRVDEDLKELILNIYSKIQSHPFPKQWLDEKVEMFNFSDKMEQDISKTIWGKMLLQELQEQLKENCLKLAEVENELKKYPELQKYVLTIESDEEKLEAIENLIKENATWDKVYIEMQNLKFENWPNSKKITIEYKNQAKDVRDKVKQTINNLKTKIIMDNSQEANKAINTMYPILFSLKELVFEFEEAYSAKKRARNSIDFNDIEHFALSILIKQNEKGEFEPSSVAKELQEKYEEIAIDEYQDSNLVQEYILNSVSKQNNIFMVGDIKQSIYRFREAKPELFLEKYKTYELVEELPKQSIASYGQLMQRQTSSMVSPNGQKIKLFQNFRSRKEVLNLCNWVFEQIMSEELGDVEYNEEEYLNPGANYEEAQNMLPELHILDLEKEEKQEETDFQEYEENDDEEDPEEKEEKEEEIQIIEKTTEEAKMVANLIEKLFKQDFMVQDKKQGKRKIQYKDIVILLRSTKVPAPIYEKELAKKQFPVFCDTSSQYLEAEEVQTILALLKVMDNPLQDIELIQVLRSPIGNFTDNDLVEIRLADTRGYFYEAMLKKRVSAEENLKNKIDAMLNSLEQWRQLEKELPLNELIWKIYSDTNYYNYVGLLSNGTLRQANLKMLFERAKQYESASFKGLYHFINFMDRLHINNSDLSSAKIVGENDNVIRIMSIHKSKGLEFPVVFLCNAGKQFNKQDLSDTILLHSELGFGPKYINRDENIQYPTVAKDAIKLQLEKELIAEEMRVLYVALTRAKEKLIITGTTKNYEKYNQKIEDLLTLYKQAGKGKVERRLLKKHTSYLDWFMFLILKEKDQNKITYQIHKLQESQKENQEQQKEIEETKETKNSITGKEEEIKEIQKQLEWQYPYLISSQIPSKTSVSKIKEEKQQESEEVELIELLGKKEHTMNVPNFANKETKNIPSNRKGTLVHLCLQKLDSTKEYIESDLQDLIEELVRKEIILQEEAEAIPITALSQYLKSNIWKELKQAKEIHKEEPFYMQIPANRVNENYPKEENILLQGVMDLYYINKNDELILVDYKTDYAKQGDEQKLIEKYKEQLNLYQEALEKALNRKVDKVIIYSTWLGEIRMR